MRNFIFYLLVFISVVFSACTKEIDIELDTAEQKLVVESIITDQLAPYQVKLSLTTPYFNEGEFYVNDAIVIISDNVGNVDTLSYLTNGIYSTLSNRQGIVGNTYFLTVNYKGSIFNANSSIPLKVNLDSISYQYQEPGAFSEAGFICALNAQDTPDFKNYYRFSFYKNDTLQTDPFKYFVVDDAFVDGNYITSYTPYVYQSNDTCRIEILSISKEYYQFLISLGAQVEATGGPFDPIPSNPPSNISNGALGFFAAVAYDTKSIVLP